MKFDLLSLGLKVYILQSSFKQLFYYMCLILIMLPNNFNWSYKLFSASVTFQFYNDIYDYTMSDGVQESCNKFYVLLYHVLHLDCTICVSKIMLTLTNVGRFQSYGLSSYDYFLLQSSKHNFFFFSVAKVLEKFWLSHQLLIRFNSFL